MEKTFIYQIENADSGLTANDFLRSIGYSRKMLTILRHHENQLIINGSPAFTNRRLNIGDIMKVIIQEQESEIPATPMNLDIIYEDEDLLIVNKPANLPIHPSLGHYEHTLANGVSYYFQQKKEPIMIRTINRLDRDTTGLTIIAKHHLSAAILYQMAADREITREYLAITLGTAPISGTIDAPIARADDSIIERIVDFNKGERAITHFKRLQYDAHHSLLSVKLETGRTHQIRVHMKHIGHPLIGDFLYYPDFTYINRQALHSHRLAFIHPIKRTRMEFEAPLPEDMRKIFPDI